MILGTESAKANFDLVGRDDSVSFFIMPCAMVGPQFSIYFLSSHFVPVFVCLAVSTKHAIKIMKTGNRCFCCADFFKENTFI